MVAFIANLLSLSYINILGVAGQTVKLEGAVFPFDCAFSGVNVEHGTSNSERRNGDRFRVSYSHSSFSADPAEAGRLRRRNVVATAARLRIVSVMCTGRGHGEQHG